MEGDSSGYSSDIKEQSGGELDYPLGVDGVVRVLCLDQGLQALGVMILSFLLLNTYL